MKSKQKITPRFASNFWYDEPDFDSDVLSGFTPQSDSNRLYKLAAAKRAISNFVRIVVPDKSIKTVFKGFQSYTDGDSVTIGANVDNISHFDSAVGLALHEAAHIKLSDFAILRGIELHVRKAIGNDGWSSLFELSVRSGVPSYLIDGHLKGILNYVEDRRIDQYIYDTAPGYRDYYRALYDKYFNDKVVTKALKSDECTDETFDSYMFRLINLHGEGSRLNALKGLPEIWKVLDLGNISRLKTSEDALGVAIQIYTIILKQLTPSPSSEEKSKESGESGEKSSNESDGESSNESGSESSSTEDDQTESPEIPAGGGGDETPEDGGMTGQGMGDETQTTSSGKSQESEVAETGKSKKTNSGSPTLTDRQKNQLDKKIQKQKDFINGDVSKTKMSKKDSQIVSQIEESGSEMVEVGEGTDKIKCILIRKVTPEFAQTDAFPFYTSWESRAEKNREWVQKGIRMGKRLAGKLQLRSDSRSTEYNRLRSGKIDRRMLSLLGAGQSNVFFTKEIDSYNNGNLHISLDASSSMSGTPWHQAIMTTTALIKAIEEIPNLEVQVSIRGTGGRSVSAPLIAVVYDSRVDKFSKVLKLFPHLEAYGTTPEGLTFEAIMGEMISASGNLDSYFLNMSDGQPYFTNYGGDYALNHTRKQVQRIESMGIKVLSYFISDYDAGMDKFRHMYGQAAKRIDVQNISQIARTMNEMFLKK